MNRRTWAGITGIVVIVTIAGCGSAKPRVTPKLELRGSAVSRFECPPRPLSPAAKPAPTGSARALLLCPLRAPGLHSKAVTVASGQPEFAALIAALSAADQPPTTGPCPEYADLAQVVLAKTSRGVVEVSIPTDSCGHYQRAALAALNRARAG